MATTGFWPVRSNLLSLINYAENPDKTAMEEEYQTQGLKNVLAYDMNDDKTEQQLYVSGINCLPQTAYERMMTTKRQFGKTDGVLAYHGYQSFPAGELTPMQCHLIGMETAKRMWGDRYEVTVSTHRNTDNLHNHFAINSTSFVDGKKFPNKIAEHIRLREISDQVCRERGFSVLEDSNFYHTESDRAYWRNKSVNEMQKQIVIDDIKEALQHIRYVDEFCNYLRRLGYYINRDERYEHISVTPPGWNRAVRVDTLMPELTHDKLKDICAENLFGRRGCKATPRFDYCPLYYKWNVLENHFKYHSNIDIVVYLFFDLLKMVMGIDNRRDSQTRSVVLAPELRQDLSYLKEHQRIIRFVQKHQIKTPDDIREAETECMEKLADLSEQRTILYNRIRRPKATDTVESLKAARDSLTKDITEARGQLKTAKRLSEILHHIEYEVELEMKYEKEEKSVPEVSTKDEVSRRINYEKPKQTDTLVRKRNDYER